MFPTDPWFQALIEQINASADYREAAATWEGDIAFLVEAEPDKGVPEDVWGLPRPVARQLPRRGRGGRGARREASAYVIRAPYSRWKEVVQGELDPIRAMMQGKLRVQGDLPTIVRYVKAANELVQLTGQVDTRFPDED